jgi:alpha-galactosidase
VGDTAGPGGTIRALRTIPIFAGFAEAIRRHAPDAWVVNYTNPMSLCIRTLYHVFPGIKALGCCHEVFGMQSLLAAVARRALGAEGIRRSDVHVNVLGLNHFTWFDRASYQNHDLMKLYSDFVGEFYETGYEDTSKAMPDQCFTCNNRMKFDLFRRYGWIAAAGDRHLAEFMPGDTYLNDPETAERWGFYLTSVDWRERNLKRLLAHSEALVSGREEVTLEPSGEEGILLIKALCGFGRVISNVNLPNTALQIANLPPETIVETNAVFSFDDVRPVAAGSLKADIAALMAPHVENQTELLHAALHPSRESVYRIFARDPLCVKASNAALRKLADDMIENTLEYLPRNWSSN